MLEVPAPPRVVVYMYTDPGMCEVAYMVQIKTIDNGKKWPKSLQVQR